MKRLTRIILSIAILSTVLCFSNTVFAEQNFIEGSMEYKNPKNSEAADCRSVGRADRSKACPAILQGYAGTLGI